MRERELIIKSKRIEEKIENGNQKQKRNIIRKLTSQPKWCYFDCKTLEIAYSHQPYFPGGLHTFISTQENVMVTSDKLHTAVCLFIQLFQYL